MSTATRSEWDAAAAIEHGGKLDEARPDARAGLSLYKTASFDVDGDCFIKGDIAIHSTGVAMRDSPKTFTVVFEELRVGETIGRGCSSYVQRAVHLPTRTPLALKVFNLFDKAKRDQLIKEITTLYDAQCPSLVTFYGAFYREGAITIALEYMDGGSLSNVLHQVGAISERALANITFQVLWGLAYLKLEKRVHRDIKPANLLINSQGQVKLTDFGVSSALASTFAMCATFVGTFKYMSPERIRNEPYSYGSDMWSLGIVLVECATGCYPYPRCTSYIDMAQTILEMDPPRLPASVFSPEFHEFIAQCLQKDPAARLPADILLGAPWLRMHGATGFDQSVTNVAQWIRELGC